MARLVEVKLLCDPCLAVDQHAEGQEFTLTLGDGKPMLITFCEPHRKEFYDPIVEAVKNYGEKATDHPVDAKRNSYPSVRAERGNGEHLCPIEGCDRRYSWRGSLRTHVRDEHDTSLAAVEGRADGVAYRCEVEGCGRIFDAPQGLALHTTRVHRKT